MQNYINGTFACPCDNKIIMNDSISHYLGFGIILEFFYHHTINKGLLFMKQKRRSSTNKTEPKNNAVIRCRSKMMPVFEHDTCKDYIQKGDGENPSNCKNCKNSF